MKQLYLFLILVNSMLKGQPVIIIIDLGGVVFKEPEHFVLETLPPAVRAQFPEDFPPTRIFNRAFEFAHHVSGKNLKHAWLYGTLSGTDIATLIEEYIDNPAYSSFFKSKEEQLLIKYGAAMIFEPEKLAQWSRLYPQAYDFIQRCKQHNIQVIILSNWDPLSFTLLKQQYPDFFSLFKDSEIFIPATSGYAKPDRRIYQLIINTHALIPDECYFIDDSLANVEAAQACGIKGIVHTNWEETLKALPQKMC